MHLNCWMKSARSGGGSDCVEVRVMSAAIGVRDSKDPGGPVLTFPSNQWRQFLTGVKLGQFRP